MKRSMDHAGRQATSKEIRLESRGKLLVAVPLARMPKLTHETVEKTRATIHDERALTARASGPKRKRS